MTNNVFNNFYLNPTRVLEVIQPEFEKKAVHQPIPFLRDMSRLTNEEMQTRRKQASQYLNQAGSLTNHEKAIQVLEKATDTHPENHILWRTLAKRFVLSGQYDEALATCDKAFEYRPYDEKTLKVQQQAKTEARKECSGTKLGYD